MTDDGDFLLATRDWLDAGSDRTPPHAIDAVLLAVRSTHQDRPLPVQWRTPTMPPIARYVLAAAAVVAISIVAFNIAGLPGAVGGPAPTPIPSPTPTPIPMPVGESTPGQPLQANVRYSTTTPFPLRVSFTAPAGWAGNQGGPYAAFAGPAATGEDVAFELATRPYKDPCHIEMGPVSPAGPTANDLVQTLLGRPGLASATPTATTLGGLPATLLHLQLATSSLRDCTNGSYVLWSLPLGATNELVEGMTERVWVVDAYGHLLVVTAVDTGALGSPEEMAILQLLDSVAIEPGG